MVGYGDVIGPNVVLPLELSDDATEHVARVDPDTHVQPLHTSVVPDPPVVRRLCAYLGRSINIQCFVFLSTLVVKPAHLITLIMLRPMSTVFLAWDDVDSGAPLTQ